MKKAFISVCIACLIAASSGCATSSQKGAEPQSAAQTTQAQSEDASFEHHFTKGVIYPLYSYPDFDLSIDDELESVGGMTASYAASELVKLIREKDRYSGQMSVELMKADTKVDNSSAFQFKVQWADKQAIYYVTEWAKVLREDLKYVGRIEKGGPEPGAVPSAPDMETKEYIDYYFSYPKQLPELDGLSIEDASAFVAHHAIAELFPNSGCKAWSITLDGISEIDGQKAYDFSIYHKWLGRIDDDPFDSWSYDEVPVTFRMAVTADRKAYLYDKDPHQVGKLSELPLPEALAPDPEIVKTYEDLKSRSDIGMFGFVIRTALKEQLSYTPYPNYELKLETQPDENELDWVRNAAENLYQWLLTYDRAPITVLQTIDNGTGPFKIAVKNSPLSLDKHRERLIVYKGKRVVDGKTQHYFDMGDVNVKRLEEERPISMMVKEDGTIYEYRAAIKLYKALPQSIEPNRVKALDDALIHDYAPVKDKTGSSQFCSGTYVKMNLKDDMGENVPSSAEAANYIFEHLDDFYQGERNINPWYITEQEHGVVEGAKTHEFTVGQGIYGSYPIYFRAAVAEMGKVYRYDGDEPIYVSSLSDASGAAQEAQDKEMQELLDQLSKRCTPIDAGQVIQETATVVETGEKARKDAADLAPKQDVDELKAFYADKGFQLPKTAEDTVKGKAYFDFNLVYPKKKVPELKGIKPELAASYIDQALIPKLNRLKSTPWALLLNSKEHIDALNKDALVFALGSVDRWDSFTPSEYYIISEDKKAYHPQIVARFIKDMPVQSPDTLKDYYEGERYSSSGKIVVRAYPRFELNMPQFIDTIEGYPIEQAAAEVEAAYLHDHNDGHWSITYKSIVDIDGVKAWKFGVSYEYDKVSFDVAATTDHKLYRYTRELKQVGALPKNQAEANEEPVPENDRRSQGSENSCGNGTYNAEVHDISHGDYVSLDLACYWVIETLGKTYTGKRNNNPWRLVPTQITKVDGVDGYEFDVGQGKYGLDKTLFKAIVTQDRKIYKLGDTPEFVGTIPEDAPEP